MPEAGTRKIVINGEESYLPAEEVALAELVRQGCALKARICADTNELHRIKNALAHIATGLREAGSQTVHLRAVTGQSATVRFERCYLVDGEGAEKLRKLLGGSWSEVFSRRVTYAMARSAHAWLQQQSQAIRKAVGETYAVKAKKPAVDFTDVAG